MVNDDFVCTIEIKIKHDTISGHREFLGELEVTMETFEPDIEYYNVSIIESFETKKVEKVRGKY